MRPDSILRTLRDAGFEAYYVGGCVRDKLLMRPCSDWDITTAALPEEVMALFSHTVPTGLKHGTVTVLLDGERAEVTTFRADGVYLDSRHPEDVRFVRSLREDLSRRDFTINAMALGLDGTITDLFGGQEDLRRGIIRCVGEPETRFREDSLRMLRACRFAAQLGFAIEKDTWHAMEVCAPLCRKLSRERVSEETRKILLSERPEMLEKMLALGLLSACGAEKSTDLCWLCTLPETEAARWTGLKILLPELDLRQFRLSGKLTALCESAAECYLPERTEIEWKALIADRGWETAGLIADLCGSDAVRKIEAGGDCVRLEQLAVSGRDFPGLTGKAVGQVLQTLLRHVLEHPEDNDREKLLRLSEQLK